MDISDAATIAAWWGAILSTVVFGWEIYKWLRSGARLKIQIAQNMQEAVPGIGLAPELHLCITIRNVGDAATTITHLAGVSFKNRLDSLRGKRCAAVVVPPCSGAVYPHLLAPGTTWTAWLPQPIVMDPLSCGPIVKIGVHHSMSEKLVLSAPLGRS